MEDRLLEILTGESPDDIEFAFELVNINPPPNLNFDNFLNRLWLSTKWSFEDKYGFKCLVREIKHKNLEQPTIYSFLVDRNQYKQFFQKLKELGKI